MPSSDISNYLAASPVRGLVAAAVAQLTPETKHGEPRRFPNGMQRSKDHEEIAADRLHGFPRLERVLVEAWLAGTPTHRLLAVARALAFGIRRLTGTLPKPWDLREASLREQRANERVNLPQLLAMDPASATLAELEQLDAALDEQLDATADLQLCVQALIHERLTQQTLAAAQCRKLAA